MGSRDLIYFQASRMERMGTDGTSESQDEAYSKSTFSIKRELILFSFLLHFEQKPDICTLTQSHNELKKGEQWAAGILFIFRPQGWREWGQMESESQDEAYSKSTFSTKRELILFRFLLHFEQKTDICTLTQSHNELKTINKFKVFSSDLL